MCQVWFSFTVCNQVFMNWIYPKKVIRLWKDLNLQSSGPMPDALSIRPHNLIWVVMYFWRFHTRSVSYYAVQWYVEINQEMYFACVHVIVRIRNQSLYIRTAVFSVILYNDCKKLVIIYNDQLKPVIIYNDQQFSLPFHRETSFFLYNCNCCLTRQNQTFL